MRNSLAGKIAHPRLRGRRVSDSAAIGRSPTCARMTFDDNALLPALYGESRSHLVRIETARSTCS